MEQRGKTPTGIIISAILLILAGVQILSFGILSLLLVGGFALGGVLTITSWILGLVALIAFIASAIGLLKAKKWARITAIILGLGIIIEKILSITLLRNQYSPNFLGSIISIIVPVGAAAYVISYLLSKKTKEFFD